ncbi:MAG: hypothetical protein KIT62_07885 [Cyclobacteriaceae bacterium]|nr:hypothetical protein [Cyclobacteriaceae bacterium]
MVKYYLLLGLIFNYPLVSWCQLAQDWAVASENYFRTWREPDLMLVLNQEKYVPGDTVFIKAFYRLNPAEVSVHDELVQVNLINSHGASVNPILFPVKKGGGQSQLVLPDSLPAGLYRLIAQTNLMRNFNKVFTEVITIVRDKKIHRTPASFVKLRPESGQLVANLPSQIGINTDYRNRAFEFTDEQGRVVVKGSTNRWGSGHVTLVPVQNQYYFRWANDSTRYALPRTVSQGITLTISRSSSDIRINMSQSSEYLAVLITGRGKVHYTKDIQPGNSSSSLSVPLDKFPAGIMKISVLNKTGVVVATRDFYSAPRQPVMRIEFSKHQYKPREQIESKLNLVESTSLVSVIRATNQYALPSTVYPHLDWIQAGFNSPFTTDSITLQDIDRWLIAETKELPWKTIIQPDQNRKRYLPLNVIERRGYIVHELTGDPVPVGTQIMFLLQKKKYTYQTFTSSPDGFVSIAIPDLTGSDEFMYLAEYKGARIPVRVDWIKPATNWPLPPLFTQSDSIDLYADFQSKIRLMTNSYEVFQSRPMTDISSSPDNITSWLGRSDVNVSAEKFIAFSTMDEFVKEVVPSLSVGKSKKGAWVRVGLTAWQANNDPLYIIDGQATLNTNSFLELKPADLKTVRIYNTPAKLIGLGLLGKQGIVVVDTKSGTWRKQPIESNLINGITLPVSTTSKPTTGSGPVFRSTIYWTTEMASNVISFPATDDLCNVRLDFIGMISSELVYGEGSFKILPGK